ncbi:MAG TPA: ABC transporter substrate-binding protein [Chloroflexota bacterium]|jgi:putative ABC transport system substrate-binding protein
MLARNQRWRLGRRQLLAGAAGIGATAAGLVVLRGGGVPQPRWTRADPPLIGWVAPINEAEDRGVAAFRDGLREQGLIEGENLRVAWRYAEGQPERLPGIMGELLELGVRVIVAAGNTPTQAARSATDRVPIVSINGANPVAQGFATSLARPGGNLTGVGGSTGEALYQKAAELLAEAVPAARRLAYIGNLVASGSPHKAVAAVAAQRGLEALVEDVPAQADVEPAFERVLAWGADLLVAQNVIPVNARREQLPELALRAGVPTASSAVVWVEAGLLLAHDYDRLAVARRGAWYVARILDGADPGVLPFEQPTAFVFAVNRATLARLGLSLPEHVALQVTDWLA